MSNKFYSSQFKYKVLLAHRLLNKRIMYKIVFHTVCLESGIHIESFCAKLKARIII